MHSSAAADASKSALNPDEWRAFKLQHREKLTGNTHLFRFELPDGKNSGMPVASCLLVRGPVPKEDGSTEMAVRPYTPTSPRTAAGYLDLVVKVYPQGKVSKHVGDLKVGDKLEMKGPIVKLDYKPNMYRHIGMVAGGSGITPMLQVIDEILSNKDDKTQVSLVFANQTESDIILKDRIDAWAKAHSDRLKVYYVVDKASLGGLFWKGGVGYLTKDMLKAHLPPADQAGSMVFVCGPPGMMNVVSGAKVSPKDQGEVKGILKELGYSKDQVFKF